MAYCIDKASLLFILFFSLLFLHPAGACETEVTNEEALLKTITKECFDERQDKELAADPAWQRIMQQMDKITEQDQLHAVNTEFVKTLLGIKGIAERDLLSEQPLSTHYQRTLNRLVTVLAKHIALYEASLTDEHFHTTLPGADKWSLGANLTTSDNVDHSTGIDLQRDLLIKQRCFDVTSCSQVYVETSRLLRYIKVIHSSFSQRYKVRQFKSLRAKVSQIKNQFDTMKKVGVPQLPWELLLNDYLFDVDASAENPLGDYQVIALHPSVGFEYLDAAATQLLPTLEIDLLGINWFKWSKEGRARYSLGASIVANWSDRTEFEDISYGAKFYYNGKYALSLVNKRGIDEQEDKVAVIFSADLWQPLAKVGQKYPKYSQWLNQQLGRTD